jgi:hypothetical protein
MRMALKRDARVLRALPGRTSCVLGLICVMYAGKVEQKIHLYKICLAFIMLRLKIIN